MEVNYGIETATGISIFRFDSHYDLTFLGSGAKESLTTGDYK